MFSFFKKKASLRSIVIPDFGWPLVLEFDNAKRWIGHEEGVTLSLDFYDGPPDIPSLRDLNAMRRAYRELITENGGGVIEVNLISIRNIPSIRTIFKLPQEPSGMTYLASITIPFATCSYQVKLQCVEMGDTGIRDAIVGQELLASGEVEFGDEGFVNLFADPYDPQFKAPVMMSKVDDVKYDAKFPDHPLSKARRFLSRLEHEIMFKTEIEKLEPFNK